MKKYIQAPLLILSLLSVLAATAQKTSDLLENGIVVKSRNKIFLEYGNGGLKYDVGKGALDFIPIADSLYFLVSREAVNIYIKPLNPLQYATATTTVFTPNQVYKDASNALESILGLINKVSVLPPVPAPGVVPNPSCNLLVPVKTQLLAIRAKLAEDKKSTIKDLFTALKDISFNSEAETLSELKDARAGIKELDTYYADLKKLLDKADADILEYARCSEGTPDPFVYQFIFGQVIKELKAIYDNQLQRLGNLKKSFTLVETAQKEASKNKNGNDWYMFLGVVPATRDKVANFTVTVSEEGYVLSSDGEIVKAEKKDKVARTLCIVKFQRFVTEVAVGTAHTWLEFPKYGTEKNASGQETVAQAGVQSFRRINFTAMINFNLFIPQSSLHPFFQIGAGANTDYPTLLVGAGIRLNFPPLKRLALSGGFATSWISTLNKLKPGDVVSGTAELEKDITHELQFPLRPYFGIQYNF